MAVLAGLWVLVNEELQWLAERSWPTSKHTPQLLDALCRELLLLICATAPFGQLSGPMGPYPHEAEPLTISRPDPCSTAKPHLDDESHLQVCIMKQLIQCISLWYSLVVAMHKR